jgi:hypothetical protein
MELNPLVRGVSQMPRNLLKIPFSAAERLSSYGLKMFTDSLELVAPTQTQEEFVESLKRQQPIAEADCALRALRAAERSRKQALLAASAEPVIGKETVQEEVVEKLEEAEVLTSIGFTMLKKNIIRAEKSDEIPDHTTQYLVFEALEVGADPEKRGFLKDQEVAATAYVFNRHDNMAVFPSSK